MRRRKRSTTPGVARIDQPEKHNHGFFVRIQRRGRVHSAFFTDKKYGGRKKALAAAIAHHRKLRRKLGPRTTPDRRWLAELRRRNNSSGIVGVKRILRRGKLPGEHWVATWSPKPRMVARKSYSVRKYGYQKAKMLAIRARRAGVRSME
ncbi:MAG TPA: AP2/ERF family transcription factor [Verrucomicrobiota bacterium]|nr:AP2/ERF family transcription factor [Verrucomicrobiota bacterium]